MTMLSQQAFNVETRTKASSVFAIVAGLIVLLALAAPFLASRGAIQNLFFILTMLVLAQCWNLLAGYAGLISVGQQLFVGCGAYAMFAVVTLAGRTHVSRVGASLLSRVGLDDLVADSWDSYIEKAVALARDAERLRALRAELRGRMLASPLTDALRFTRAYEEALRREWAQRLIKRSPVA